MIIVHIIYFEYLYSQLFCLRVPNGFWANAYATESRHTVAVVNAMVPSSNRFVKCNVSDSARKLDG